MPNKSLGFIYFLTSSGHRSHLFKESGILKFPDKIALENYIFINKNFNKVSPTIFKNWFTLSTDSHVYDMCWSSLGCLVVPPHKTKLYGRNSINISVIYTWNYLQQLNANKLFINYHQVNLNFLSNNFS